MSRYDENSEYSRRKPRETNRDYDDIDYTDEDNYENDYEELGNNVNWDDDDDYEDFQYDFEKDLEIEEDDDFVYSDTIKNSSKKSKNKYIDEDDDDFDFDLNDENDFFRDSDDTFFTDESDEDDDFLNNSRRTNNSNLSDDDDYGSYDLDDDDFDFTLTEDEEDVLAPKRPLRDRTGRSNLIEDDELFVNDNKSNDNKSNKFKDALNSPKVQEIVSKIKALPIMDKLKSLDKKFLLVIGFALFIVFFMLFNKEDSTENNAKDKSESPSELVNKTDDFETIKSTGDSNVSKEPDKVVVTEKEHKVDLISNSSEEVVQEKAKDLSKKTYYDDNVESSSFDRTSLYDKPIGRVYAPYVKLDSIVYSGASELNMRRGVGTVEYGEQLTEKTVAIAGHRSRHAGEFFTSIIYLTIGDHVYVDTWDEEENVISKRTYTVEKITKVDPSNTDVLLDELQDDRRKLVLITCSDYNTQTGLYDKRWIVEAYEVF